MLRRMLREMHGIMHIRPATLLIGTTILVVTCDFAATKNSANISTIMIKIKSKSNYVSVCKIRVDVDATGRWVADIVVPSHSFLFQIPPVSLFIPPLILLALTFQCAYFFYIFG